MRRFSAILAVLALALVLTACGKDDDRNNGGDPSRPDTNQSQNAPQDTGSGGSSSSDCKPKHRRKWGVVA